MKMQKIFDPLRLELFTDVWAKCLGAEVGGPRMPHSSSKETGRGWVVVPVRWVPTLHEMGEAMACGWRWRARP